jgi:hypothetical protein
LFRNIWNNGKISGDTPKKDRTEIERMVKALIKSLENKPLTLGILGASSPTKLEKNHNL